MVQLPSLDKHKKKKATLGCWVAFYMKCIAIEIKPFLSIQQLVSKQDYPLTIGTLAIYA